MVLGDWWDCFVDGKKDMDVLGGLHLCHWYCKSAWNKCR